MWWAESSISNLMGGKCDERGSEIPNVTESWIPGVIGGKQDSDVMETCIENWSKPQHLVVFSDRTLPRARWGEN